MRFLLQEKVIQKVILKRPPHTVKEKVVIIFMILVVGLIPILLFLI